MKYLLLILLIPNVCFGFSPLAYEADYVRSKDGDTYVMVFPIFFDISVQKTVRLAGADTPEVNAKMLCERVMASQATLFIHSVFANAEEIVIYPYKMDSFGRIVADLTVDGRNVSELLIEAGYAIEYKKRKSHVWCTDKSS